MRQTHIFNKHRVSGYPYISATFKIMALQGIHYKMVQFHNILWAVMT